MSHLSDEADLLVADLHALIGDAATECMNIVRLGWGDGAAGRLALERFEDLMFNVNRIAEKLIAIEKARIGEEPANSRIAAACGQRDCIRPRDLKRAIAALDAATAEPEAKR